MHQSGQILIFRNVAERPGGDPTERTYRRLKHPLFAWAGLRPILAQHTREEHEALQKWGRGRRSVVEIGVAEGASALGLREAMDAHGTLYLIDPFHLGRIPTLNTLRRAAQTAVGKSSNGHVIWIRKFSHDAARSWDGAIDCLLIDGDHSLEAVRKDWEDWSRFVVPRGVVLLHDARIFPKGWPTEDWGPVQIVNTLFRRRTAASWRIVDEVHSLVVVERVE